MLFPTMNLFIIFTITAVIWLYLHLTRNFKYWKNKNVPYAKPVLLFGSILNIVRMKVSLGEYLRHIYATTKSPYLGFFVFDQPFLLVRDPELIKLCLIKDFEHFDDRSIIDNTRDDQLGSDILLILKNPVWKPVRKELTPLFSTGKMKNMLIFIITATDDLMDYLTKVALKENSTDAREVCMKFTTDVISSCAFGINAQCFKHENAEFRVASRRMFDLNLFRKFQNASYFFAPFLVKIFRMKFIEPVAGKFLKDIFENIMMEREKSKNYSRGDFVDTFIQIKKQNNNKGPLFEGEMLAAQAVNFFNAGFETTGSTISFALYELSLNSLIQDCLRHEIRTVLEKHDGITYEAIQEMNYLDMVISETLRKYPVVPFLDRRCKKSYKIPGTDIVIDKGLPIYISLLGLHFDPQYFPNPEIFDPNRFTSENKSKRSAFCYMPFGEGPRNCIGARFGLMTTKLALIRILSELEVELSEKSPVPMKLDPNGFLVCPESTLNLHFKRAVSVVCRIK